LTIVSTTLKYELSGSSGVVGENPFKAKAKFEELHSWKYTDKLNKIITFEYTIPNDEFTRANALIERDVFVPFLKPFNGLICKKEQNETTITMVACENAFHLTRRIYRKNSKPRILYGAPTTNIQFEGTVEDITGPNNGTWTGTETYEIGKLGQAGIFDGSSFVSLANEGNFDHTTATKYSISVWVKTASNTVSIVSKRAATNEEGWDVLIEAGGKVRFAMEDTSNATMTVDSVTSIDDGKYHHITCTYDGSNNSTGMKIYFDGVDDSTARSGSGLGTITNNIAVQIGAQAGARIITGDIDDVRLWPRELTANGVTDVFKQRKHLTDDHTFEVTTAANVLALDILTAANADMPANITWTLSPNFPTDDAILEFHYQNHYDALDLIAESLGKDLFFDNKRHLVFIETKGKTLSKDEVLDVFITSKPETSTEDFANDINILGKKTTTGEQLEDRVQTPTVLKYNYEKVVADQNLNTQDQLSDVGDALLLEFQKLTPQTKGEIPITQFNRLALSSGDVVKIAQPDKQLSGSFRVMDIIIQPDKVKLSLEKTDTAIVRVRSSSLTDVIDGILRRLREQSVET